MTIDHLGTYAITSTLSLIVKENLEHNIVGQIVDKGGKELGLDDTHGSLYQRWFYCWDGKRKTLWFWSSDIGGHRWKISSEGSGVKEILQDADVARMPQEFWERLPDSVQSEWSKFRAVK